MRYCPKFSLGLRPSKLFSLDIIKTLKGFRSLANGRKISHWQNYLSLLLASSALRRAGLKWLLSFLLAILWRLQDTNGLLLTWIPSQWMNDVNPKRQFEEDFCCHLTGTVNIWASGNILTAPFPSSTQLVPYYQSIPNNIIYKIRLVIDIY